MTVSGILTQRAITGISKANPGVVTSNGHGLQTGDVIFVAGVVGMVEVNDRYFTITRINDDTFSIGVNTTAFTTYTSGGTARVSLSQPFHIRDDESYSWAITGTWVGVGALEFSDTGGATYREVVRFAGNRASVSWKAEKAGLYRFRLVSWTSGALAYSIAEAVDTLYEVADRNGDVVFRVTDDGVEVVGSLSAEVVGDVTGDVAGVVHAVGGAADGAAVLHFGGTLAEGLRAIVVEETIDLTDMDAKFVPITHEIPAGAVILSAQANIEALVVAGGTTVKVALGINDGDVDKYGISADLTKNAKISTIPDWAVLSSAEQIDVCGVVTNGSALGDADITAGLVRVRIVYLEAADLADAD